MLHDMCLLEDDAKALCEQLHAGASIASIYLERKVEKQHSRLT